MIIIIIIIAVAISLLLILFSDELTRLMQFRRIEFATFNLMEKKIFLSHFVSKEL